MQNTVCFQFKNTTTCNFPTTNTETLYQSLKQLLGKVNRKTKHVYIGDNGKVKEWEIVCNKKGNPVALEFKREFGISLKPIHARSMFHNEKHNELLTFNDMFICAWDLKSGKKKSLIELTHCSYQAKIYSNGNTKYFILSFRYITNEEQNGVEIWDLKTRRIVKCIKEFARDIGFVEQLLVDNERSKLIVHTDKMIKIWCLKTFECLKTLDFSRIKDICFVGPCNDHIATLSVFGKCCFLIFRNAELDHISYYEFTPRKTSFSIRILYSTKLNLLLTFYDRCIEAIHPVICHEKKTTDLNSSFKIEIPISGGFSIVHFVNEQQTHLLVGDEDSNMFIVDLILKKVIWEFKAKRNLGKFTTGISSVLLI